MFSFIIPLFLFGFVLNIQSYPSSCTCNSLMQVGSIMMGGATYLDSTYQIAVSKSGVTVASGDTVSTGDILSVDVTPNIASTVQYVIESTSGIFTDSNVMSPACKHSRTMNEAGSPLTHTLLLTTSGSAAITVTWMNADAACAISSPFHLIIGGNSSNIVIPTTSISTTQGTQKRQDTTLGIVLGIGGVISLLAFFKFKNQGLEFFTNANICAMAAIALTLINFALVISWATDGSIAMKGFLNTPSWTDNPFPFHPIFMVTLTLNFQIFRFIFSDFLTDKSLGLYNDVLLIITLMGVIIGIAAVGSYKNPTPNDTTSLHRPNLTTMHSWIGFGAAILISLCVLWFLFLRICQDCAPIVNKGIIQQFHFMFVYLPMAAFFFTSLAVSTGISDQLNQSACVPKIIPTPDYTDIQTPVYSDIPEACKYANGLGISVVLSTIATVCMIRYRVRDFQAGPVVSGLKRTTLDNNDTNNNNHDDDTFNKNDNHYIVNTKNHTLSQNNKNRSPSPQKQQQQQQQSSSSTSSSSSSSFQSQPQPQSRQPSPQKPKRSPTVSVVEINSHVTAQPPIQYSYNPQKSSATTNPPPPAAATTVRVTLPSDSRMPPPPAHDTNYNNNNNNNNSGHSNYNYENEIQINSTSSSSSSSSPSPYKAPPPRSPPRPGNKPVNDSTSVTGGSPPRPGNKPVSASSSVTGARPPPPGSPAKPSGSPSIGNWNL